MARAIVKQNKTHQNFIINGAMEVAQRGTSFVSPSSGNYLLDRWGYSKSSEATHTVTQDTDVPTFAQSGYVFTNSMRFNLTAADTSITAGQNIGFFQRIEGHNFKKFAQKNFTVSFWVKATLTGTYCMYFLNTGEDRTYIAEYTINTTNTWQKVTITVPASPSAGTWNYTNGTGITVGWTFAASSTLQTTAGSWQSGSFRASANQINGVNTGATDFRITGVMVNEGDAAQPYINFSAKALGEETEICKRYYEFGFQSVADSGAASGVLGALGRVNYTVPKRAATNTLAVFNGGTPNQVRNDNNGASEGAVAVGSQDATGFQPRSTSALTDNVQFSYGWTSDSEL